MKPNGEWKWRDLTETQQRICILAVIERKKNFAIARELGLSFASMKHRIQKIYNVLNVDGRIELAYELGRHWKEIKL